MADTITSLESLMEGHCQAAQAAGEKMQADCWEHFHEEAPQPEGMLAPFDGCNVCEVREIIGAAVPHLRKALMAELVQDARDAGKTTIDLGDLEAKARA